MVGEQPASYEVVVDKGTLDAIASGGVNDVSRLVSWYA